MFVCRRCDGTMRGAWYHRLEKWGASQRLACHALLSSVAESLSHARRRMIREPCKSSAHQVFCVIAAM